ncbi:MAG: VTT domain-containing protein [Clostridia bacterium]|nr:VTT domain-containing protein [Clostridia bacterium]
MNVKKIISILEFVLLIAIVVGIPTYLYFFQYDFIMEYKDINKLLELVNNNKFMSSFIYLGIMVLQIIISVIPGQIVQMAAGYIFSIPLGLLLSILGVLLGSTCTYFIAKLLGKNFIEMIFGEDKVRSYRAKLNSKKAYLIVFLIYLIPGIPKDLVGYVAGISEIDYAMFIAISTIGRLPGLIGCIVIGEMTYMQNYTAAIVIGVIATILFVIGIIYRKKIENFLDQYIENKHF